MPGLYLSCEYCPVAPDEMDLIFARFDHFEKLADFQMLAMLSCIFSEPAAREGVSNALMGSKQEVSRFSSSSRVVAGNDELSSRKCGRSMFLWLHPAVVCASCEGFAILHVSRSMV